MITFIISALKIIILLGFLIFIHELGHFLVAKLCKVKVNEFALGFGPVLFKKKGKETIYQLRLIPLGGFVSMEGEEERSEEKGAFNKVCIPKRIAIVAAGGLVNIIFAIIVYMGLQTYTGNNVTTEITQCTSGYAAESVGLQTGDIIKKINGKTVRRQSDINKIVNNSNGEELTVTIQRNDQNIDYKILPTVLEYNATGMFLESEHSTKIQGFDSSASIQNQGFKIGDIIISVNNINVENDANKLSEILQDNIQNNNEKMQFIVKRNNEQITIDVTPIKEKKYLLGVQLKKADNTFANNFYYAIFNTGDFAFSIIDNIKMLFSGKVSTNDLMGPVGISSVVAKTNCFQEFIYILALISLSLGVTNLLPFPPLDGGKIVLLIIEAIRRKPLKEKYEIGIQMVGFGLMIMLSLYVTFNDINRIV
ncbi:MAG: RIP metalloprotease RseP [Clostridia bacterium]|nr:RIP metalloprotease RseP [Clostridia bacterium]